MRAPGQTEFTVPGSERTFTLHRLRSDDDPSLRAWDNADTYALAHLSEQGLAIVDSGPQAGPTASTASTTQPALTKPGILIVNDLFGALAVTLAHLRPQSWGDSVTSHRATVANLERNEIDADQVSLLPSTDEPTGPIDVAVIKIPRSLALLEDQLRRLAPLLTEQAIVVGAGMTKSIHNSTIALFERHVGPSPTSLARRKARLILAAVDPRMRPPERPAIDTATWKLPDGSPVVDFPNVFSRGKLDHGTRVMLDHIAGLADTIDPDCDIVDLGCGNGLLGLSLARFAPTGRVTLIDESYQAAASARATAAAWALTTEQLFLTDDSLDQIDDGSVDVVVNNPPFHSHQSRTGTVALRMFDDARRVLRPGGRLLVVGNRHLGYHRELERRFAAADTVAATPKFVVLEARI